MSLSDGLWLRSQYRIKKLNRRCLSRFNHGTNTNGLVFSHKLSKRVTRVDVDGLRRRRVSKARFHNDDIIKREFRQFIANHVPNERRNYVELDGRYIHYQLRDTDRYVVKPHNAVTGADVIPKTANPILKTLEICEVGLPKRYQQRGIFADTFAYLIKCAKKSGNWSYLYVECIHPQCLINFICREYPLSFIVNENCIYIPLK